MPKPGTVFLMYHELEEPGRALCQTEPGYVRYVLHSSDFRVQMEFLKNEGWRGVSVGEAVHSGAEPRAVAITFDDGSETDLLIAAPVLKELGFGGTFYITSGFLGNRGYLNPSQLRELCSLGFEIGCHSRTHTYLTNLDENGLRREMAEAKFDLEQITGTSVEHFSCPGGRHNQRISEFARAVGYRTLATSRIHANSQSSDRFALGRIAMLRTVSLAEYRNICCGRGLWQMNMSVQLREVAQRLLGNSAYDRLRAGLLGHGPSR
jgi:peptidoglycan/xylan/chitin deacetylase (PgdA/CDA1 family)